MNLRIILSAITLFFFLFLAGGSITDVFKDGIINTLVLLGILIIIITIFSIVQTRNKKKRIQIIKKDEQESDDFDRSVHIGDDRCKIYFDINQKKVMIMHISTQGLKKIYINNFEFPGYSLANYQFPVFNIYDYKNRQLLSGSYSDLNINYTTTNLVTKDKNSTLNINSTIIPFFVQHIVAGIYEEARELILIDEAHAFIAITKAGILKCTFNYVDTNKLAEKKGSQPCISTKTIGNYVFIMDDYFNILILVTPDAFKIFNYSDIIDISYIENAHELYTKSASRTIAGAVIGGALMGHSGAIIGGLSGANEKNKEVNNMIIKILLKDTVDTSYKLKFNPDKVLKTKNDEDKKLYDNCFSKAMQAKDLLSILIDKVNNHKFESDEDKQKGGIQNIGIADELTKLAKLKDEGIISEEEFQSQKAKLLN